MHYMIDREDIDLNYIIGGGKSGDVTSVEHRSAIQVAQDVLKHVMDVALRPRYPADPIP
jgi:hypothetical protein